MDCNCKSYKLGGGDRQEVVLDLPDNIDTGKQNRTVSIDACIADAIKHLWNKEYETLGCCCGHGISSPSIIIADGHGPQDILAILLELSQVDKRDWDIYQLKLTQVG